ncbi:MAG: hypothetical protein JRH10_05825 [Deltaproteobacteria bacterium]|nr:hypothetical protein [Deltaproteobacteria bacterium]MBW2446222.1 hypothetical protein [Deltaproteobacteria bacterium]
MVLEDLGNLGDFVGGLAVIVTLLYLAAQIRRSNLLATAEANRFAVNAPTPTILAIAQDSDLARVFREGLRDRDSLQEDDKVRFDMLMGSFIGAFSGSIADQALLGYRDDHGAGGHRENLRAFLGAPGGAAWWAAYKERQAPAIRVAVEEILRPSDPPAA